ncbi:cation:proton antiporter [Nonomuraea sediminis]|uniref:cation:proton antiporter n=1 Tax=Nonomuraea sediminis TaxID=2835864 RepID=UPI001BDC81D5|nr:cation:proton antiporter [Nonomuraea sediminis]
MMPPPGPQQVLTFLLQLAVLLMVALCMGRLAMRLRMPAVVGELLSGVLLGPTLLGRLAADGGAMPLVDAVGQLGMLLLVGVCGAQLDTTMLRHRAGTAVRVSLAGLLIPLALGVAAGLVYGKVVRTPGDPVVFALFLGVAMCVSAIPVIAKTLTDMNLLHRDLGQLTLTAGVFDDAVGWFLLTVVSAMATAGLRPGQVGLSILYVCGFVVAAWAVGRPLVRVAFRVARRAGDAAPSIALAVVVILLGAAATQAMGMEPVFGAFVAGLLLGSPGAAELRALAALRTTVFAVLAPIFLAAAGLRVDLTALGNGRVLLLAVVLLVVAIIGKFAGAYLGARLSGLSRWEGLALGAGMNARGAVEVVVAMVGLRLRILDVAAYTVVILIAAVTSLIAPPLLRLAMSRVHPPTPDERRRGEELSALASADGTRR